VFTGSIGFIGNDVAVTHSHRNHCVHEARLSVDSGGGI
jgi:hypothetical protein